MFARILRWTGLVLGVGVGLAGCVFAAGYAFTDWPLWVATAVTALWVVPTAVLSRYALRRPEPAARVLLAVRRTGRAGMLLAGVALVQLVALVVNVVMHETGALPPGPGFANAGVVLWMLVVGALFVLAEPPERGSSPGGPATPEADGAVHDEPKQVSR